MKSASQRKRLRTSEKNENIAYGNVRKVCDLLERIGCVQSLQWIDGCDFCGTAEFVGPSLSQRYTSCSACVETGAFRRNITKEQRKRQFARWLTTGATYSVRLFLLPRGTLCQRFNHLCIATTSWSQQAEEFSRPEIQHHQRRAKQRKQTVSLY